jgi:hypothetical protein
MKSDVGQEQERGDHQLLQQIAAVISSPELSGNVKRGVLKLVQAMREGEIKTKMVSLWSCRRNWHLPQTTRRSPWQDTHRGVEFDHPAVV